MYMLVIISLSYYFASSVGAGEKTRLMKSYDGKYCDDGQNTVTSVPVNAGALRCAAACTADADCVACNFRVSTGCTFRETMCAQADIKSEEGAVYRGR